MYAYQKTLEKASIKIGKETGQTLAKTQGPVSNAAKDPYYEDNEKHDKSPSVVMNVLQSQIRDFLCFTLSAFCS